MKQAAKTNGNGSHNTVAPFIDNISERAHHAIDTASDKAGQAADWLDQRQQSLRQSRDKLMGSCTSYIAENPAKAVGIALAAGLALSLIFGGSNRRR